MSRQGIMQPHSFSEKRVLSWKERHVIYQPKVNGERCRALKANGEVVLFSSEGNIITSVPHIEEALNKRMQNGHTWDGELYAHGMLLQDIRSIVSRTQGLHPDYEKMQYWVFDMLTASKETCLHRLSNLIDYFFTPPYDSTILQRVSTGIDTPQAFPAYLKEYINEGFEGIIVRNPSGFYEPTKSYNILKFKPKAEDYYRITGVFEAVSKWGEPKSTLGGLYLEDASGNSFKCGAGSLTHAERKRYWEIAHESPQDLYGSYALLEYPEKSRDNIPLRATLKKIVTTIPEGAEDAGKY